jgi:hypothetical protein
MSFVMMVTRLAWMAHKLVSAYSDTKYASAASWRAKIAVPWKRRSFLKSYHRWEHNTHHLHVFMTMMCVCIHDHGNALTYLSNFANQSLKRCLLDEQFSCPTSVPAWSPLISSNLTQRYRSCFVTMWLCIAHTNTLQQVERLSQSITEIIETGGQHRYHCYSWFRPLTSRIYEPLSM